MIGQTLRQRELIKYILHNEVGKNRLIEKEIGVFYRDNESYEMCHSTPNHPGKIKFVTHHLRF